MSRSLIPLVKEKKTGIWKKVFVFTEYHLSLPEFSFCYYEIQKKESCFSRFIAMMVVLDLSVTKEAIYNLLL